MEVIIVGGGPAGISAASAAYSSNPKVKISVFSQTEPIGFDPSVIPFVIGGDIGNLDNMIRKTLNFYNNSKRLQFHPTDKVREIVVSNNLIRATTTTRSFRYDSLIIATGSRFSVPDVEGNDLKNIFTAKTLDDCVSIEQALTQSRDVVVYGAGPLGVEMAIALKKRKMKVTMIESAGQVLHEALDPEIALFVQNILEMEDIEINLNTHLLRFSGKKRVRNTISSKGEFVSDLVILATKTIANTELALNAGLKLNEVTGGICVNQFLQTSVENVFAAGDCAQIKNAVTGFRDRCKLGSTAIRMGQIAGMNACGGKAKFPEVLSPWIVPLNKYVVGRAGCTMKEAIKAGYKPQSTCFSAITRTSHFPNSPTLKIMLVVDKNSKKVLGGQIVGNEGVKERIDFLAYLINSGARLEDLTNIECSYAPSIASTEDPIVQAARRLLQAR